MRELSFYFFQCVNDRIQANANMIEMYIVENSKDNRLELLIRDNGQKFDVGLVKSVDSTALNTFPALKFLQQNCIEFGGDFKMLSHAQTGNLIDISYPLKSNKRPLLGNVNNYLSMLFVTHPQIHFIYSQISQKGEFLFDSEQFKHDLGDMSFENIEFLTILNELLVSETNAIRALA